MPREDIRALRSSLFVAGVLVPNLALAQAVTTYHNDTLRTGWNPAETSLTVANVGSGGLDLQATTKLDSQVDAQPLVVPNQAVGTYSARTVVYVVTGGDTIYAIDAGTGTVLASRNLGTPVPQSALPGQCNNNGPTVGITSTPVIDVAHGTMYLIADTYESGQAVFRVHAVSLSTLQDTITPSMVTASSKLSDGTTYHFNPNGSRQRAALLLSGSTLYAAFSSYCDNAQSTTRGWLLGWTVPALAPLAHNNLTDNVPASQSSYFLNSIWMSGYGPSTASANNMVYVVTSNSDKNTYGAGNRDESVLKLTSDLATIQNYFTDPNRAALDAGDQDFGSGGALRPPPQPGLNPKLLLAAGKNGTMYLFDRSAGPGLGVLATYPIGGCWCGESYFQGSDGAGRVVSSGGSTATVWRQNPAATPAASRTTLTSTTITRGQDPGFFPSRASNGTTAGTAIVWAVGRPTAVPGTMPLYAIDPASGKIIYTATAGNWVSGNSNANTVPTIANGHVYVATYQELAIFGLGKPAAATAQAAFTARAVASRNVSRFSLGANQHAVWGTIRSVEPTEMTVADRHGTLVRVYLPTARASGNLAEPVVGEATVAIGRQDADGLLLATNVLHAKSSAALWPADQ